nr:MAG TPA: hypothetical protein [Caudoviricetes sp.]
MLKKTVLRFYFLTQKLVLWGLSHGIQFSLVYAKRLQEMDENECLLRILKYHL